MSTPPEPKPHEVAELVQDLAEKGHSKKQILKTLETKGMADVLDFLELQDAMERGKLMRGMVPVHPTFTFTRIIGALAIAMGIGALVLSMLTRLPSRSMDRYGLIALVLGLVLFFKPDSGGDDI